MGIEEAYEPGEIARMAGAAHDREVQGLRISLAKAEETIRKLGEESLRDQEKLRNTEKARDIWKDVAGIDLKKIHKLRNSIANIEKRAQAARDIIAKRLRNCPRNFHEENPGGCTGSCGSFGCKTLRGIRDTLKE